MKRIPVALPVLAAALAMTPAAMADSFTYTISGSNFSASLHLTAAANIANGVATPGTDTITSVAGTLTVNGQVYNINSALDPETANFGSNANNLTTSGDGEFLFDNLFYPEASGNDILDWGGLLVDDSGYELNLFSGSQGSGAPGDLYFYFADNGSNHSNNRISDWCDPGSPVHATVVATPEPGSLLLLGSGLLAVAFAAFRKARPSGAITEASWDIGTGTNRKR